MRHITSALVAATLVLSACGGVEKGQTPQPLVPVQQTVNSSSGLPTGAQEADHQRRLDAATDDDAYNAEVERWNTTYPNLP